MDKEVETQSKGDIRSLGERTNSSGTLTLSALPQPSGASGSKRSPCSAERVLQDRVSLPIPSPIPAHSNLDADSSEKKWKAGVEDGKQR